MADGDVQPRGVFSVGDGAAWRCWMLVLHHVRSQRIVAVVTALRKQLPPQAAGVQRLAFVALGTVIGKEADAAQQLEGRLCVSALRALGRWKADKPPPPLPRMHLVAQCEALNFTYEFARRVLPLRPSCAPLIAQACDAIIDIARAACELPVHTASPRP